MNHKLRWDTKWENEQTDPSERLLWVALRLRESEPDRETWPDPTVAGFIYTVDTCGFRKVETFTDAAEATKAFNALIGHTIT